MGRRKKEVEQKIEPKYITESIEYGDKDFIDCMKSVIKGKLAEK
jgi:hypothetical protein